MAVSKADIGAFARSLIVNGFDRLSEKVPEGGSDASPIQKLAAYWRDLPAAEREQLAAQVTQVAELAAAALPVALTAARKRVRRRVVRKVVAATDKVSAPVTAQTKKDKKQKKKDKKQKRKDKKKGKKKKKK
jgi:hypothetical protein